jgi:hypothetical protein
MFKLRVVMHCNHVKMHRLLHLKQILFIPCTEKAVQKKVVETFLQFHFGVCFTMKDVYIMYPMKPHVPVVGFYSYIPSSKGLV